MHAGLLRPRKAVHPEALVVSVPLPHTAVISQPRNLEVHVNFNGLDHVLGVLPRHKSEHLEGLPSNESPWALESLAGLHHNSLLPSLDQP